MTLDICMSFIVKALLGVLFSEFEKNGTWALTESTEIKNNKMPISTAAILPGNKLVIKTVISI